MFKWDTIYRFQRLTLSLLLICSSTVNGCINPDDLGVTLTHEHLSMVYESQCLPPPPGEEHNVDLPFTLENSGWIRQYPYV